MHTFLSPPPCASRWSLSMPILRVIGPGGREDGYPPQPPSRAVSHAAQARLRRGWGFCCRGVLPQYCVCSASRVPSSSAVKAREAGSPLRPSRLQQLQGDRRGMSGNGDEPKQSLGGLDLAVFEAQSLFLEQPKELFDDPSRPVPVDDLPGGSGSGDDMGGEQPPRNRLAAAGRVRS